MLRYGLTIGTGPMLRVVQSLIRRMHVQATAMLQRYWIDNPPDLVVSVIPNFNREIFEGLRSADEALGRPPTPVVTILTDLADYPPHFWIERQEQYLICGTEAAMNQALAMGHPKDRVFRTSGMIVRPEFYNRAPVPRAGERVRLGLHPDLPTGLVMFGGYGSRQMLTVARRVAAAGLKTQLIFMCGHNRQLSERVAELKLPFPFRIEGFCDDIPRFMQLADYFVGKPGPGSISEALVMGLPVVVERNSWTMVQERFNTDWIVENQLGVVLHSFAEVAAGILPMLDPDRLASFREHVRAINNRAIFEIPEILARLLASRVPQHAAARFGVRPDSLSA
jgi:1,2-diacylglycerol 3-beta-galactosyltransferase